MGGTLTMAGTPITPLPPMADAGPAREPARQPARRPERLFTPREPDQKYAIYDDQQDPAFDYKWEPTRIVGLSNARKLGEAHRAGWDFACASEFPDLTGCGYDFPADMVARGLLKNVEANEPIEIDDQVLLKRPKELSLKAREREKRAAYSTVANQMQRLQQAYRPADPRQPGISRRFRPMQDSFAAED